MDVAQAESIFDELSQRLAKSSKIVHKTDCPESPIENDEDLEKGTDANDRFDLREYLTSSNDANERAGIKHKHVGVTWEDLQVDVIGGAESKVAFRLCYFHSTLTFWWLAKIYVRTFGGTYHSPVT